MTKNRGNFAALVIGDYGDLRDLAESQELGKVYQLNERDAVVPGPRLACDVVLLEWKLASGAATLSKARASGRFPSSVPIIAISSNLDEREMKVARDAGVADILTGPPDAPGFFSRVTTVLTRARIFVRTETYCGPDRRLDSPRATFKLRKWRREDLALLRGRPLGLRNLGITSIASLNTPTAGSDTWFN
jgi:DNA-binding response OmpR family regulator